MTANSIVMSVTNSANQVIEEIAYFNVSGLTYSATNAWMGTASNNSASGNYHSTKFKTSARGWRERVLDPTGTITRSVTDGLGRILAPPTIKRIGDITVSFPEGTSVGIVVEPATGLVITRLPIPS